MFELQHYRTRANKANTPIETLGFNAKFYSNGAYHKVLSKTKTNVQAKNIRTGKVIHIKNKTFVEA